MKIVQINSTCDNGSTGKICLAISERLTAQNIENYIFYSIGNSQYSLGIKYMNKLEIKFQALLSKFFGNYGFQSRVATKRLIKKLEAINPDIVHLHNLHSHNINLELLFLYLRKNNVKIIWTFHDCWAFTAYCSNFSMIKCNKWKIGCHHCPQYHERSFLFDRSQTMYERKRKLFSNLNMTIVTPSQWLASIVSQSFMSKYPRYVINNGIDLSLFCPTEGDFRKKNGIGEEKKIILGVAFGWSQKKGLDVFIELAKILDSQVYQIILVGTDKNVDKRLPSEIISIHRTNNQKELVEIYTATDVFVNPTREEVLGLTNIEANACGVPVITFNTGGSPECIDEKSGSVVSCDDLKALSDAIIRVCSEKMYKKEDCIIHASAFDTNRMTSEYVTLYEKNLLS